MRVARFHVEHLLDLPAQPRQREGDPRPWLQEHPDMLAAVACYAWSLEEGGEIVGCVGMVPVPDAGEWNAWALLSEAALRRPVSLTRAVRQIIRDEHPEGTLRADPQFAGGEKWLRVLGFQPEHDGRWTYRGPIT